MLRKYPYYLILLVLLSLSLASVSFAQQLSNPIVTEQGPVRGEILSSSIAFRGIPYAAPPIGNLRWKAPQPALPRTQILDAIKFGNICPQFVSQSGNILSMGPKTIMGNEDCLTLNIWTSKDSDTTLKPVMFFIHGGGNVQGSSSQATYEGQNLASQGGVVVVTINYRLGPFGFLAYPELTAEDPNHSSGNYGLLDQIAALQWVQKNIRNFGGDPQNVTIFGESAGGLNVSCLLSSPLAKGLFQRAIVESGGYTINTTLHDQANSQKQSAEAFGQEFAKDLNCTTLDCLRSKTPEQLLMTLPGEAGIINRLDGGTVYGPNIDGYTLPDQLGKLVQTGQYNNVPVMLGTNKDEGSIFIVGIPLNNRLQYRMAVKKLFPPYANKILKEYPVADYNSPKNAFEAIITDLTFVCPARVAAKTLSTQQPATFVYNFSSVFSNPLAQPFGAFHGSELPFVFNNFGMLNPSSQQRDLATKMLHYWTNFAKNGDPNDSSLPTWPRYTIDNDSYLNLDVNIAPGTGLRKDNCQFFGNLFGVQTGCAGCESH